MKAYRRIDALIFREDRENKQESFTSTVFSDKMENENKLILMMKERIVVISFCLKRNKNIVYL